MKEMKIEDRLAQEDVKVKVGRILNKLIHGHIFLEDYSVVLFLISAFKDGLAPQYFRVDSLQHQRQLIENINASEKEKTLYSQYNQISTSFESDLKRLKDSGLKNIFNVFLEIDRPVLIEHFPAIFDSILFRIGHSQGFRGIDFVQPAELTRFMCGFAELKKGAKIYNPFAGAASFAIHFDQEQYYYGQEINQRTWAIGTLRLMAYQKLGLSKLSHESSTTRWPIEGKFDLIISQPPFRMNVDVENEGKKNEPILSEQFLIENGLKSLSYDGKLIVLVSQGILYNGFRDKRLREYLVDNDFIDTIVSFPSGLLFNTSIPVAVMILSRRKQHLGKVRLIDATKFVEINNSKQKVLKDDELSRIVHSDKQDDSVVRVVDNADVCANNYNLSLPRYFQKSIDGTNLGELLELLKGSNNDLPEKGRFVRVRDLKDDNVDFALEISSIEEGELRRTGGRMISEDCLLIAVRWRALKPTYFKYQGESIIVSNDILAFKVNESIVDIAYLINELQADYVKEQADSLRTGATIPYLRREDLLKIVIKLLSLNEQKAKVQGVYELVGKFKTLQQQQDAIVLDKSEKQHNEFASLKHTLGRPRQNILSWAVNLIDFLENKKNSIEVLNGEFAEYYEIDIINALKEIKRDVDFMTAVLKKGENGLILSEHVNEAMPLSEMNILIKSLSSNGMKFQMEKTLLEGKEKELGNRGIYINEVLFRTMIDNILTNANRYGFDTLMPNNEVRIKLSEEDGFFIVEISNNGNPFPKNFDREKFITKYSTADSLNGQGIGGYDINRIASYFNNPDWELILNEDPLFPVKFRFRFIINYIN